MYSYLTGLMGITIGTNVYSALAVQVMELLGLGFINTKVITDSKQPSKRS